MIKNSFLNKFNSDLDMFYYGYLSLNLLCTKETNSAVGSINGAFFVSDRAEGVSEHVAPYWDQPFSQPYFDNSTRREYTTTVGQTAHLHCRVRNLGDRAVSFSLFVLD